MSKQTISFSELNTFAKCRQMWQYSYAENLKPKTTSEPLEVGDCIHKAIMVYYQAGDWKQEIRNWLDGRLAAGIENPPQPLQNEQEDDDYFDVLSIDVSEIANLAEQVVERYILRYGEEDRTWKILEVEKRFEIPIPNTDYLLVGIFDLVVEDSQGNTWLVDHKCPKNSFRDYESLELDTQIGIYQWAAQQQQLGYNALGFIYNQIKRKLPKAPAINKTKNKFGGKISIAEIDSDWETYEQTLVANGESYLLDEYREEMIPKLEKKVWFQRNHIYRSQTEIDNFYRQLVKRMTDFDNVRHDLFLNNSEGMESDLIYMNPERYTCGYCDFKGLCVESIKGQDISFMIEQDFERRKPKGETQ